jgi:hypothetical protein
LSKNLLLILSQEYFINGNNNSVVNKQQVIVNKQCPSGQKNINFRSPLFYHYRFKNCRTRKAHIDPAYYERKKTGFESALK